MFVMSTINVSSKYDGRMEDGGYAHISSVPEQFFEVFSWDSYFSIRRQKVSGEQAFRVLPSKNLRSLTASKLTFKGKLSLDIAACKGPQYVPFNSCSSTLFCLFSNSLIIHKEN